METATLTISAAEVNKLRQRTGLGMMDCKKALVEANGNIEQAIEILRKKGQKVALNRGDRQAMEGYVIALISDDKKFGNVLSLNCETDFVAKNEEFVNLALAIARSAIGQKIKSISELKSVKLESMTVEAGVNDIMAKTGEKIELTRYEYVEAPHVFAYNHPGNKIASIAGLNKETGNNIEDAGKEMAMQVTAMNPIAVDKGDVNPEIIQKEIEIGKEQARAEGKPENILEKIAQGKLNKFYQDYTLLNQPFIRDAKKTVSQYLKETDKDLTVTAFKRISLKD